MKTVVIGATFYGCGLAADREDTLVLEPSVVPGWEFSLSCDPGRNYETKLTHPAALEFEAELRKRQGLVGNQVRTHALTPELAAWSIRHKVAIRFNANVIARNGNELEISGADGRTTLHADRVIDARPKGGASKYLYAYVEGEAAPGAYGPFELQGTAVAGRQLLRWRLDARTPWQEARPEFYRLWANRPAELESFLFIWAAVRFACNDFDNPLLALDAGLRGEVTK